MAVPNSFVLAAAQMGHEVVVAHPRGYELDGELMKTAKAQAAATGGKLEVTNDVNAAFYAADVIYAKSWGAKQFYGAPERETASARRIAVSGLWMNRR